MDFSRVKSLTIPEGNVNKITINGVDVWKKKTVENNLPITLIGSSYSHSTNYTLLNLYLHYYQPNSDSSTRESLYTKGSDLSKNITANIDKNLRFSGQIVGKSSTYKGKFKIKYMLQNKSLRIRVRTYKKKGKKRIYSTWSKAKKIQV